MNDEALEKRDIEEQNEQLDEYELPLLKIADEDGNEMYYACLHELELNSKKYLITMELEADDDQDDILENPFENDELEVFIFIEEGEEDGNQIISIVEDDDEFNEVVEEWNRMIEQEVENTNPTKKQ